ncbi:MAG: hypothetical protein H7Y04_01620 [Verrucomicrobia bacterium]|nr:hypothetical protein [Cytophagales bacterium]
MKKKLFPLLFILLLPFSSTAFSQEVAGRNPILLNDPAMQTESMEAVNNLYNYNFEQADVQFRYFKLKYPTHPLPYFLLGLSEWWKIMPEPETEKYDEKFLAYMDTAATMAERMYDKNSEDTEAAFFLAAAYGFKGRLHAERKNWRRAALAGKSSLKYLDKFKNKEGLSIEFLFGDALYNYYREWIPENYKSLKPILVFFDRGDKKKGMEQLIQVSRNAFYTRTEAQVFLMRIYDDEKKPLESFQTAKYLYDTYPDNPYFHRYYARATYSVGQFEEAEKLSLEILSRVEKGSFGYEATSGRYASYYLGYIYNYTYNKKDLEKAKTYYKKAVAYAEQGKAFESGYYHAALAALARMYVKENKPGEAKKYYETLLEKTEKKSDLHKEAEKFIKEYKKRGKK